MEIKKNRLALNSLIGVVIGILYLPYALLAPLIAYFVGPSLKTGLWMTAGLIAVFPAAIASNYWPRIGGIILIVSSFITATPFITEYRSYRLTGDLISIFLLAIPSLAIGIRALALGMRRD